MKKWEREKYLLKSYNDEMYRLDITSDGNISHSITSTNYEELYVRAKEEAEKGNHCEIWCMLYEFIP